MFLGMSQDHWIELGLAAGGVILAWLAIRLLSNLILKRLIGSLVGRTKTDLDDRLLEVTTLPLQISLLTVSLNFGINSLTFLPEALQSPLRDSFFIVYVLVAFFFLWRLIAALAEWYGKEAAHLTDTELDEQLLPFFRRVALLGLLALMLIILLGHFGVEVSGLVATLGVSSLVIGLAGQAALSDTISGFVLMIDRPFRIGDRIEILELDTWGDVVDVGLRSARIRTRDNRTVVVPNSILGKSLIVNHSFPDSHYRIEVHIGVAYGSEIEHARATMIEAAQDVEGVWPEKPVEALFIEMADSALVFRVRVWIESYVDTRRIVDRVNTAIYAALQRERIELPFPTRTIKLELADVPMDQIRSMARAWKSGGS